MGLNLKFNVENMGNIEKAIITIKPLTIIAGENSSGKTFVTKSLYTILNAVYKNHFSDNLIKQLHTLENTYQRFSAKLQNPATVDFEFEKKFSALTYEVKVIIAELSICEFEEQKVLLDDNMQIVTTFENEILDYFNKRSKLQKFKKHKDIITRILSRLASFMEIVNNRREVIIENIASHLDTGFKKNFQITDIRSLIRRENKKNMKLSLESIGHIEVDQKSSLDFSFEEQGIQTVQNVENIVFFDSPIYIKIRQALQKNRNNAINMLISRSEDRYLKGYPEYLDNLYTFMDKEYIDTPDFHEISKQIEELISGKVHVSKSGDINYTDTNDNTIPLSLTAMGISNIGLIDLLIRNNVINKGSFLIMDEPEVHLHPQWQVALANILYDIAKNGANIIIATHSLDFLKAFEKIINRENKEAEKIIAINKMPFNKEFSQLSESKKVNIILDDLSKPFYDLYMQDI